MKARYISDKQVIKELKAAMKEIDVAWEYAAENSPLDFAIAVPYCTIKNLIDALKVRQLIRENK